MIDDLGRYRFRRPAWASLYRFGGSGMNALVRST
jgi:hypothetical protein